MEMRNGACHTSCCRCDFCKAEEGAQNLSYLDLGDPCKPAINLANVVCEVLRSTSFACHLFCRRVITQSISLQLHLMLQKPAYRFLAFLVHTKRWGSSDWLLSGEEGGVWMSTALPHLLCDFRIKCLSNLPKFAGNVSLKVNPFLKVRVRYVCWCYWYCIGCKCWWVGLLFDIAIPRHQCKSWGPHRDVAECVPLPLGWPPTPSKLRWQT